MDLVVNGSSWGLSGINLIHQAYKVNKDGLPKMKEIGKNGNCFGAGFDHALEFPDV